MMNSTSNSGGPTITPNTLNAITGALNGTSNSANNNNNSVNGNGNGTNGYHQQSQDSGTNPSYITSASNAASTAANGLFLLSQAHQELTKREEAARANTNGAPAPSVSPVNGKRGSKRKSYEPVDTNTRGKRTRANGVRGRRRSVSEDMEGMDDDDEGDEEDGEGEDENMDVGGGVRRGPKKPETEEEKRRNFLERNRQGLFPFLHYLPHYLC
jgi:ATF/CREB family transcription factor